MPVFKNLRIMLASSSSRSRRPILLGLRSSKNYIIATVATAIFTDLFIYAIVVPVLPFSLESRAQVSITNIQTWISIFLAVYGGALLVASPFVGWLADRTHSRRWPMILGLVAIAGATVLLCVGSSIGVLLLGRVLQGLSAAVVWVVGFALLVDTVGTDALGAAMGYVGISMSLAILLGPMLGGIVFAASGYYAVWYMAFGLVVLDIFMRLTMIEKKVARKWLPEEENGTQTGKDIDRKSSVQDVELGVISNENAEAAKKLPIEIVSSRPAPVNRVSSAAQDAIPQSCPSSIRWIVSRLPPVCFLLASRRLLSALWVSMVQASLLTAFDSILPLYVRDTFHWTSLGAGLIFLPTFIPTFLGPIVGGLNDRLGPRRFVTSGMLLACPPLILMRLVHEDTLGQKVLLCALLAIVGFAFTLIASPIMAEITYVVEAKERTRPPGYFGPNGAYAQAYALFNCAWAAGTLVGPLLAGLVNQVEGWGTTTLILGLLSAATAVPAFIWTGGSIFKLGRQRREQSQTMDSTTDATAAVQ